MGSYILFKSPVNCLDFSTLDLLSLTIPILPPRGHSWIAFAAILLRSLLDQVVDSVDSGERCDGYIVKEQAFSLL